MSRGWLLLAACAAWLSACHSEPSKSSSSPGFEPVKERQGGALQVPDKVAASAPKEDEASSPAMNTPPGKPGEIAPGMSRQLLMQALGSCAQRTLLVPANLRGSLTVEVFQPKAGKCQDDFGRRQFFVVGEKLHRIEQGVATGKKPPEVGPRSSDSRG